jgi:hypothetical protein
MATSAGVLLSRKFRGRQKIGPSLADGIRTVGDKVKVIDSRDYRGPFSDILLFYGFDGSRDSEIYKAYCDYQREGRRCVYVDLGYFRQRASLGRYGDYHRFTVNGPDIGYGRHPTAYFQRTKHPSDRISQFGIRLEHRKKPGDYILLAGMSDKCARFEGFSFEQWERDAVAKIRQVTDRPIHYRPKPNKHNRYTPLPGTVFAPPTQDIGKALRGAWATVSHHSNAGIDGICLGIPAFCAEGVCLPWSADLSQIETPLMPTDDERRQWLADIAYCQWNRAEMDSGAYWKHLKDEGLV